nr:serine hydrolase domain-containing protein [Pseudonocardia sp. C8]
MAELASHRSGLPVQPGGLRMLVGIWGNNLFGLAPWQPGVAELFAAADAAPLGPRGETVYSNLGTAVLGQALAVRAGTPYEELVRQLVTGPLGMTATTIPDGVAPPGATAGHDTAGRVQEPWIGAANAPAGSGVFSTVTDLVRYTGALADPGSPVAAAAVPRYPSDYGRIGYGWYTLEVGGHTLIWKNGGSGGMRSSILVEPSTGRAAIVLGNSEAGVDGVAAELLGVPSPFEARTAETPSGGFAALGPVLVATAFPVLAGLTTLGAARGGWRRTPRRASRAELLAAAGTAVFFLFVAWTVDATDVARLPWWLAGCVLTGAGAGQAACRWRGAPAGTAGQRVNAAFSLLLAGVPLLALPLL